MHAAVPANQFTSWLHSPLVGNCHVVPITSHTLAWIPATRETQSSRSVPAGAAGAACAADTLVIYSALVCTVLHICCAFLQASMLHTTQLPGVLPQLNLRNLQPVCELCILLT